MRQYKLEMIKDGSEKCYFIRNLDTYQIERLPSKYLMYKTNINRSPNTVRRSGFALVFYLEYVHEKQLELTDVYHLDYEEQNKHFVNFLNWLKAGNHTNEQMGKSPDNGTCNAYLKDVFRFYLFLEKLDEGYGSLKVLSYNQIVDVNTVGVKRVLRYQAFKGYLKQEEHRGIPAKQDEIVTLLQACTNCRDQLLLLLLAETGFRIGEILGVDYSRDIDYTNHLIKVSFRKDNENNARAKNAEYRKAKISDDTFSFLMYYLSEYRALLQHQKYLFIVIEGKTKGQPLKVGSVYSMLKRMEKKTHIKSTPHMLRRYFANMRKEAGWRLEMISQALGHKHIETTVRYLNLIDDDLIAASNEFYEKHSSIYRIGELL